MDSWALKRRACILVTSCVGNLGPNHELDPNAVGASWSSYAVINQDVIYGREVNYGVEELLSK